MRRGKKPTRKQKERLQRAGLPPDNWLIIREKPTGEMIILHRRTNKTRYVPAAAGQSNTPVKKEYIMNYMYIGNVSGHSTNPSEPDTLTVFLYDPDEAKKPPVMLTARGTLAQYIHELDCTDHEEKSMRKRFHYNSFCVLQKVEVWITRVPLMQSRPSRKAAISPNLLINFITRWAGRDASHPAQQRR